ncbi:MAG: hypothetical protein KC766_35205, partial [Myxococcales bacterium]|nr:hypothetical protein [Myxococcales bacterium]
MTNDEAQISDMLRRLWRRRASVLAANVAVAAREHREIAHAATLIGEDYHERFVVELIQNANDQALRGGLHDSTVLVVRTEHYVAVSNGGQAVTEGNLERISSLADSDKTGLLVGNKGVGFKAVYQVTDEPEVYSAPDDEVDTSVFDRLAVGFALERQPFEHAPLAQAVEQDVRAFFAENDGLARSLAEVGHEDPVAAVRPEFAKVAGFKFPLPRTAEDLARRVDELRVPSELRAGVRTLVVLPLRDDKAGATAQKVIDRLVTAQDGAPAQGELAALFLDGVGQIVVIDHVRGKRWSFSCQSSLDTDAAKHVTVDVHEGGVEQKRTHYWMIRTDVFDCDERTAAERRALVDRALKRFGLEAWSTDDPLAVTVALPKPRAGVVGALGSAGRFCLGLPTEQSTGLPAHVDARFFAKINRDGVIFDEQEGYNELLLDVATSAFGALLTRLRASDAIDDRRAATLALHRPPGAPGPLADRVYGDGG